MKCCIVYSSVTGNTEKVALFLAKLLSLPIFSVDEQPSPTDYDCFVLGFWVLRGMPDPKMLALLTTLRQKYVFFFATHAAWAESEHVRKCKHAVESILQTHGNTILGSFTCQGRVHFRSGLGHHPMTPERQARLEEASNHPNAADCAACAAALKTALAPWRN